MKLLKYLLDDKLVNKLKSMDVLCSIDDIEPSNDICNAQVSTLTWFDKSIDDYNSIHVLEDGTVNLFTIRNSITNNLPYNDLWERMMDVLPHSDVIEEHFDKVSIELGQKTPLFIFTLKLKKVIN